MTCSVAIGFLIFAFCLGLIGRSAVLGRAWFCLFWLQRLSKALIQVFSACTPSRADDGHVVFGEFCFGLPLVVCRVPR